MSLTAEERYEMACAEIGRLARVNADNAAELRRLHSVNAELLEALQWAMSTGRLGYSHRLPGQNEKWCDAVDRANAAISRALGQ